jgi:hypothetical protein
MASSSASTSLPCRLTDRLPARQAASIRRGDHSNPSGSSGRQNSAAPQCGIGPAANSQAAIWNSPRCVQG